MAVLLSEVETSKRLGLTVETWREWATIDKKLYQELGSKNLIAWEKAFAISSWRTSKINQPQAWDEYDAVCTENTKVYNNTSLSEFIKRRK